MCNNIYDINSSIIFTLVSYFLRTTSTKKEEPVNIEKKKRTQKKKKKTNKYLFVLYKDK
jgi:hypothetical protein